MATIVERVTRANSKQAEAPAAHLMTHAIADVGHAAGDDHDEGDVADSADDLDEAHTIAARRNRNNPIAVNSRFGIHAQSAANASIASPANEQIVMTT